MSRKYIINFLTVTRTNVSLLILSKVFVALKNKNLKMFIMFMNNKLLLQHNENNKTNFLLYEIVPNLTHSRSWALLEEPPIVQILKNFPAFYGTRNVHYRVHKSPPLVPILSQINQIPSHPISLRFNLILFTQLRLGLSGFPTTILYAFIFSPFELHALPISSSLTWSL
jgi:hypothetical protein